LAASMVEKKVALKAEMMVEMTVVLRVALLAD
jgi:hypothetical protein